VVVTEVIEVPRSVEEAFAYVADFTTVAEWDPGIHESRRVSGEGGVGTVYAVRAEFRGKTMPFTYTVTSFEGNERIVLDGVGEKATSLDTIAFEASADGGTRITYSADFKLKGVLRVAEPFLGGTFRSLARRALAGLDARLAPPVGTSPNVHR
jgi:carbon monoxide dehydrogenase subunit G